jgi:HTH-type transcriptional regulator/antitoxin HigA
MIKPIKTAADHQQAIARIRELMDMDPPPGSEAADELQLLAQITEIYEKEHFDIGMPDPISAITFRMEQQGLTPKDLVPYLGSPSRVSEVLNGKRPLSLAMIRSLHAGLEIPLNVLMQEMPVKKPRPISRKQASILQVTRQKRPAKPALRVKQRLLKKQTA